MAGGIINPGYRKNRDIFDLINVGLNVAQTIQGMNQKSAEADRVAQADADEQSGTLTGSQVNDFQLKGGQVAEYTPGMTLPQGGFKAPVRGKEGVREMVFTIPPENKKPTILSGTDAEGNPGFFSVTENEARKIPGASPTQKTSNKPETKNYFDEEGNERLGIMENGRLLKSPNDAVLKPADMKGEKAAKQQERIDKRTTPFGIARTDDDAKKIKEGAELKENFDRKLDEMIALREKFGAETLNREAVARGKQLSKDLLLLYKNMASLGVLSQADQEILDQIIPSDPLQYDLSNIAGQDPTMTRLKSFKNDVTQDFSTRLKMRIETPTFPKTVINSKTGKSAEVQNEAELKEANEAGFL